MTKKERRTEILKYIRGQNQKWHSTIALQEAIAKVMGYEIHTDEKGSYIPDIKQRENVDTIICRMAEQGYIQLSKTSRLYKVKQSYDLLLKSIDCY